MASQDRTIASRTPGGLPTGTVSFLFTDIEGSTDLLQRVGDEAYRDILEQHHRLMRGAFEPVGGVEVDTQGDAFFVAFASAPASIAAAVAAQSAFAAHGWPDGVTVRVRMGLHTGEPTLGPGGYVGIDVHRAARICAAGYGGQILISERTHSAVQEALPEGITLRDLGEHRLKDLARPEHIFQAVIPGLPADFPPLKSLDVRTTNLPSRHLTSFIGRERETAEIKRLLGEAHLVTLMGPGGSGKTRLALQVAADLLEAFPRGAWLVELAPIADPGLVPQTVASVFGVREGPGRPLLDALVDYLRPRDLLLVLDNCEHLVEAAASLAGTLLRGCQMLRILATSREALAVPGEVTYRVPPLGVPDPRRGATVEQVMQSAAARLFIERAVLSNPAFAVDETNAGAIAQVVQRLDGIPLAIELAAARVRVLPVGQIARRLDDRFRLLTGGGRGGLAHHQTLRAAVDWSYDLLSPEERALFRRLSVFAGGFTLEAAEAVCTGEGGDSSDVLDFLTRLVDKSLVGTESIAGDLRYRMLETIRQYSRERLAEADEADAIRQRHLTWYLAAAEQAGPALRGPDQLLWLERLELEHDNFRAALEWAKKNDAGGVEAGLQLAGALHRFWVLRGYLREGREWLEAFLSEAAEGPTPARARAAYGAAVLAFHQGDYARAEARSTESLAAYRKLGHAEGTALSLNTLGIAARNRGDYVQARSLLEQSAAISRTAGHRWALAEALNILGVTARRQGDLAAATALVEESLALWRQLGDRWGLAASLGHLGVVARQRGDYERSRALHEESLALRRELGDRRNIAAALMSLGIVARHLGDYQQAGAILEESLTLSRELGDKMSVAASLCSLGLVAHRRGEDERAAALLEESLALSRALGDRVNHAAALCNLGFVAAHQGDYARAGALHRESLNLYRSLGDWSAIADCLTGLADVSAAEGQADRAARFLGATDALRRARGVPLPPADRVLYERAVASARTLLGEEAFAAAWASGQTMSTDEAIREALTSR
ncbi:MAG: tetratricopeptide repeat protein [Armatimonadota bacterium]|nr:tetratricopeptide repeat protein [Armatimonadota bacterium]